VELPGSTPNDFTASSDEGLSARLPLSNPNKRPSSCRSYFTDAIDDIATQTTNMSSMSSPIPELEQLQLRRPRNQATTRRSFDRFQRIPSSAGHTTSTSLDIARPYSHLDLPQRHDSSGAKSRRSSDSMNLLPVLAGNILERNDSTTSTAAVVLEPQMAKRYQANPVYIRKQSDRHRSLSSKLPHLQNQSSLTEDLADWMTPPGAQNEQLESVEWQSYPVIPSLSMSVVSCPAITQVYEGERTASTRSASSSVTRKSLSATATSNPTFDVSSQIAVGNAGTPDSPSVTIALESSKAPGVRESQSELSNTVGCPTILSYASNPAFSTFSLTATDADLSLLQQKMLCQSYVTTNVRPSAIKELSRDSEITSFGITEVTSYKPNTDGIVPDTPSPPIISKPISAQAKRRAAHQRRMELAFGNS
jgi:hypothetical protein